MTNHIQALESRRHFAISVLTPTIDYVVTLFVAGSDAADTITVSSSLASPGSLKYDFFVQEAPGTQKTFNADDLQVYGYGGNDTILVEGAFVGRVAGGRGDDTVKILGGRGVSVSALSPAEQQDGMLAGADIYEITDLLEGSVWAGDGDDTIRLSGDSRYTDLYTGDGIDTVSGIVSFEGMITHGQSSGELRLDVGGWWDRTYITGGPGGDTINCRQTYGGYVDIAGGPGDDQLYGGRGNDRIHGGAGDDWMDGGAGDDYFNAVDGLVNDVVMGGDGYDIARFDYGFNTFDPDEVGWNELEEIIPTPYP